MSVIEYLRFNVRVGLVARRQRMLGQPRITKCSTKKGVTTYRIKGRRSEWEIKVRRIDYDAPIRTS